MVHLLYTQNMQGLQQQTAQWRNGFKTLLRFSIEHMSENKEKKVLLKKRHIIGKLPLLLGLVSLYCFLQGRLVWSGIFFIFAGILNPLAGLPYVILFILIGLMFILLACKKMFLLWIVACVITIIAYFDSVPLIRSKYHIANKSEFLAYLRENEVTYKLWNKLRRKYKRKS